MTLSGSSGEVSYKHAARVDVMDVVISNVAHVSPVSLFVHNFEVVQF